MKFNNFKEQIRIDCCLESSRLWMDDRTESSTNSSNDENEEPDPRIQVTRKLVFYERKFILLFAADRIGTTQSRSGIDQSFRSAARRESNESNFLFVIFTFSKRKLEKLSKIFRLIHKSNFYNSRRKSDRPSEKFRLIMKLESNWSKQKKSWWKQNIVSNVHKLCTSQPKK